VDDVPHRDEFVEFSTGRRVLRGALFDAPLGKTPIFHRVGSIIPKQMRLRRSSEMMIRDPFTLFVTLDQSGEARGTLYLDDQTTFAHTNGDFLKVTFSAHACSEASSSSQTCSIEAKVVGRFVPENKLERVIFAPASLSLAKLGCASGKGRAVQDGKATDFAVECDPQINSIVWRKPWVDLSRSFVLSV
jgi:Domain of unknown function (DUF5110)